MSRNFHHLHVRAAGARQVARIEKAITAYAKRAGFERVKSARGADRLIRLGARGNWLTILDEGHAIDDIVRVLSREVRATMLEAYCEASAIVWLALYSGGRRAGAWAAAPVKRPPAKLVAPLLVKTTPRELAEAWADSIRQVFPETALAVAAKHFGITVDRMFGDDMARVTTIALRRERAAWKPRYVKGPPGLAISGATSTRLGGRELVFEGEAADVRLNVRTTGGPGKDIALAFGGSALANGYLTVERIHQTELAFVHEGERWIAKGVEVPAALVDLPDISGMSRREQEKYDAITRAGDWWLSVGVRAHKPGECTLSVTAECEGARTTEARELIVMRPPWRPSVAHAHVITLQLFAMHRLEHATAHIALRGTFGDVWPWARPHLEAWRERMADRELLVMRAARVLAHESTEGDPPSLDGVLADAPAEPGVPFQISGRSFQLGTFRYEPPRHSPDVPLAVQLVLSTSGDDLAALEAICDDALARGVAHSAVVAQHQYPQHDETAFEEIACTQDCPIALASWQATHTRGVDKRLWLSGELAAPLDRGALPAPFSITPVGTGIRIQLPDEEPRRRLELLIAWLGRLVPAAAAQPVK